MAIPHQGEMAALATAFCWTFTALSFEAAGKRIGSLSVNLIRLVIATGFLALFTLFSRGMPLPLDAPPAAWAWLAVSGLVGLSLGDMCLFRALVLIGPRLSTLIMSVAPLMAALLGWLTLGEKLSGGDALGMALTLGGVGWVVLERRSDASGRRESVSPWGVALAFLGAAGQGGGLVLSKIGLQHYADPFAATQIRIFAGIAGFAVLFLLVGWWSNVFKALGNRRALGLTFIGAFFGPFLGVSLSLLSVKTIPTGVAQTIMSIVPVLIIPFVIFLNKERVSLRAVMGAVCAVAGVSMLFLF
jgi:drug/metabolite transporter (DMT)-like permease